MGRNQVENILFTFKSLKRLNLAQKTMYRDFTCYNQEEKAYDMNKHLKQMKEQGGYAWEIFTAI